MNVRLTYQTSIATFIQFVMLSFLTLGGQLGSIITTCRTDGNNCVSNLITSTILFILVAVVFGAIWLIGYGAQSRRSKRLAQLLIGIEALVALVSLFSIKLSLRPHKSVIGAIASFVILVLACWIASLAFRLMRAKGGRIVVRQYRRPGSD